MMVVPTTTEESMQPFKAVTAANTTSGSLNPDPAPFPVPEPTPISAPTLAIMEAAPVENENPIVALADIVIIGEPL